MYAILHVQITHVTYTNVPDTGTVEEKRVSFSNLSDVRQVPNVETVIIVHHCYLDGWGINTTMRLVQVCVCVCVCMCVHVYAFLCVCACAHVHV